MKKVLVVAAHPDDEVLGAGGSIMREITKGSEVHVIILAEGITARDHKRNRQDRINYISQLGKAAQKAHDILGSTSLKLLDFPDNRMDSVELLDVIKVVEKEVKSIEPEVVYTHHSNDLNIDHRITHQAVMTACRPEPGQEVKKILCFEVSSSTEWQTPSAQNWFMPNCFVDISDVLESKLKALEAYKSEMRSWPHSRSIKAVKSLARWRGASMGCEAAEAFIMVREIIN